MRTGIFIDGGHFFFTSKYTMYSTFVANSSNNLRLFFHPSTLGVTSVIVKGIPSAFITFGESRMPVVAPITRVASQLVTAPNSR